MKRTNVGLFSIVYMPKAKGNLNNENLDSNANAVYRINNGLLLESIAKLRPKVESNGGRSITVAMVGRSLLRYLWDGRVRRAHTRLYDTLLMTDSLPSFLLSILVTRCG